MEDKIESLGSMPYDEPREEPEQYEVKPTNNEVASAMIKMMFAKR